MSLRHRLAQSLLALLLLALLAPAWAQDTVRDDFNTASWGENSGTRPWSGPWSGDIDNEATRVVAAGELQIRRAIARNQPIGCNRNARHVRTLPSPIRPRRDPP